MALTGTQIEEMAAWCATNRGLEASRREARRFFFAEDDPRPVNYWPGVGDQTSRERRFLGWFLFGFFLPDGRHAAELAVEQLVTGAARQEALDSVGQARYVLAIVSSVIPGAGVVLELEDERFEVRQTGWSRLFGRGKAVASYLIPTRRGRFWLPGPGWLEWPVLIGPNMRRNLKELQPDPIAVERLLQMRADPHEPPQRDRPQDTTLADAVARMTAAAEAEGRAGLVMTPEEWAALVLKHSTSADASGYAGEVLQRVGNVKDHDELNVWLDLAMNIWNTTPQPDRGGKSAYELSQQYRQR